jgi:hypothetical protein
MLPMAWAACMRPFAALEGVASLASGRCRRAVPQEARGEVRVVVKVVACGKIRPPGRWPTRWGTYGAAWRPWVVGISYKVGRL